MGLTSKAHEAVARIRAGGVDRGTAFFISDRLAVTAAHAVKGINTCVLRPPDGPIIGKAIVQKRGDYDGPGDHANDWAVLELLKGASPAWLALGQAGIHDQWSATGFSREGLASRTLNLVGEVSGISPEIQLVCSQAIDPRFRIAGASGSPILVNGAVAGILVGGLPGQPGSTKGGIIFATPIGRLPPGLIDESPPKVIAVPEATSPGMDADWIDHLTQGAGLAAKERVRRLLEYYCGVPGQADLFAGRATDLADLRSSVLDPDGERLVVLDAPAGRGKTTLLCHLAKTLAMGNQATVVFHPFSERFRTADSEIALDVLLGRLKRLHQQSSVPSSDPREKWAQVAAYLRRPLPGDRRLVVVLDGIDEATNLPLSPDLIPAALPSTTSIVISVRSSAHLDGSRLIERLGWRSRSVLQAELSLLSRSAVEAVLADHLPELASDPANARRLFELCDEGDPLVLGLLLDEWSEHGAGAGPTQRGLQGLWQRQIQRSENDALSVHGPAWHVVAALASAIGPIARADLLTLLENEVVNGLVLDRALEAIGRFVLELQSGMYVFCHPRLREHVYEALLSPAQRAEWQERLARWCIEHALSAQPPAYAVPGKVLHLQRVVECDGLSDEWLAGGLSLLEPEWLAARTEFGGLLGYLGDLQALRAILERDDSDRLKRGKPARHITSLIRCALWLNSARDTSQPPLNILTLALQHGLIQPRVAIDQLALPKHSNQLRGLLESPWKRFVPLLPANLVPEALDRALELASRADSDDGLLWALMPRIADWYPARTLIWLGDLERVSMRIGLLAAAHRSQPHADEPHADELQTVLAARARREAESVPSRNYLWGSFGDLEDILGAEAILPWVREAADLSAAGPTTDHRHGTLILIARHLPAEEQASRVRIAMLDAVDEGADVRRSLLHQVARHIPEQIDVAVDVLRTHVLVDELAGWLWPDPKDRAHVIHGPNVTTDREGLVERCSAIRSVLTEDEFERLKERAIDIAVRAAQNDLGLVRGLVFDLEPEELVDIIEQIEAPEQQFAAARQLIKHLPPEVWLDVLTAALESGSRDAVFEVVEATKKRSEVDVAERLALVEQLADPLMQSILFFDAALRGHEPLESAIAASRALNQAIAQGTIKPVTKLRFCAMFASRFASPELIESVLKQAEDDVQALLGAWQQVWHFVTLLKEPWHSQAVRRLVSALLSEPSRLLSLPRSVESGLPDGFVLELKRAQLAILRGIDGGRRVSWQLLSMLPLVDEGERPALIAEALQTSTRIGDHQERFKAMCQLGASNDALERTVEPLIRQPNREARLQAWRSLPDAWFGNRPDRQRAWIDDELAYFEEVDPAREEPPLSLRALENWGADGELDSWKTDRRARLADWTELFTWEEMRDLSPDVWGALMQERESPIRESIQLMLLDFNLVLPDFTIEEACAWARRLPLYQAPLLREVLGRVEPEHRAPVAEELWDYLEQLSGAARVSEQAKVIPLLNEDRRSEAIRLLLADAGASPLPVLWECAPLLDETNLQAAVELAGVVWGRSAQNLWGFVNRLLPAFRRTFIPEFLAQLKDEFSEERQVLELGSPHHSASFGPGVSQPKGPRQFLLPHLVACDDGPGPSLVFWSEAATPTQPPPRMVLERLGERLSGVQLREYLRGWQSGRGSNWIAPVIGVLGVALLNRSDVTDEDRSWLMGMAVDQLFRPRESRTALLNSITEMRVLFGALADGDLGVEMGSAIEEAGQRWP